jgi:hypothetical protein
MLDLFFCITDCRRSLLQFLLPYDIARFLAATDFSITETERKTYMDPCYDIFYNYDEIQLLMRSGVAIMLLGNQMHLLQKRLKNTKAFIDEYGNDFVIDLMAIAYCDPGIPLDAYDYALAPSYRFTMTDQIIEKLGDRKDIAYAWLERSLDTLPFTNTTLATLATPPTTNIRLKQFRVNLRCFWFKTIDLTYPEEGHNIFDWSFDEDVIETSVMILRHDGDKYVSYSTRSCGRWLAQPTDSHWGGARGTPALTQHRPSVNMQEIMIRLELPVSKIAGIIRVPVLY